MVDALYDAVKFLLQSVVGADVEVAFEQGVKRLVEILTGSLGLTCLVGVQSCLKVLFHPGNQIAHRIGSGHRGRSFCGWGLRLGCGRNRNRNSRLIESRCLRRDGRRLLRRWNWSSSG